METSLHRQLKSLYADDETQTEVPLGDYRIDAVAGECLVEVQHGSLSAIRQKVQRLLKRHSVLVVKPIIATKRLVKRSRKGGRVVGRRRSPKRGSLTNMFDELVYFTRVFPHRNLSMEAVLVEVEEWRYPGHGRRRRWRANDHVVEDQKLIGVAGACRFAQSNDLWNLLPPLDLPNPFHTGDLAEQLDVDRWVAQRIAYVMRHTRAVRQVGKKGNALLYTIHSEKPAVSA